MQKKKTSDLIARHSSSFTPLPRAREEPALHSTGHTSAYVSIRQHTSANRPERRRPSNKREFTMRMQRAAEQLAHILRESLTYKVADVC